MSIVPKKGIKGLVENWQSDAIAAISVALIALPLSLGIGFASGVPPIAGVFSAIIGGLVVTFFRGSHLGINGPDAGLIAVILGSIVALDDHTGQALNYTLAAIVVSGFIQVVLGILKLGRFGELFHTSIINGILAAIGIIIVAKQIHFVLGTESNSTDVIQTLLDVFRNIETLNPFVTIISILGLLLLIYHSKINYRLFHFLPAPMWVLVLAIPFVFIFNFFEPHELSFFGKSYFVGPDLLVNIPDNVLDAIAHPNFEKMWTLPFWGSVISITMIASIETLAIGKAVDKIDPYKRKTNLNKDLIGNGIATILSGAIGGLPIITVIARSSVNVHNNAKTKWSNFYHGLFLLLFVFVASPVIQKIPLCALAVILVYTGYKLASPKIFKQVYAQGIEQILFFIGTIAITLMFDLLTGIIGGMLLVLILHIGLSNLSPVVFLRSIFNSGSNLLFKKDGSYQLNIKGVSNFLSTIHIDKLLIQIPLGTRVNIDLSGARLVDFSIMEHLEDYKRDHSNTGGIVNITGLENHVSSTSHKHALKIKTSERHKVTHRELRLRALAEQNGWEFKAENPERIAYLETFYFFKTRPIKEKHNCIIYKNEHIQWEIMDVTFDEAAYMASEIYHTTLGLISLPIDIPKFTIEKKGLLDRYINLSAHKDIDYEIYADFSGKYLVKVENKDKMVTFFTDKIKTLIEESNIPHLESNGEAILIFNDNLRTAQIRDFARIVDFTEKLTKLIKG